MREKTSLAVARAKEGDHEALRFLYVTYSHNIYGYVRSIVRDDHEAEDVTQHVFAKLMTSLVKYDDRGVPFFAWLLRLARNVAIDHLRANRVTPTDDRRRSCLALPGWTSIGARRSGPRWPRCPRSSARSSCCATSWASRRPRSPNRMGRSESSIHGLHHRGRRTLQRELELLDSTPSTRAPARQLVAA